MLVQSIPLYHPILVDPTLLRSFFNTSRPAVVLQAKFQSNTGLCTNGLCILFPPNVTIIDSVMDPSNIAPSTVAYPFYYDDASSVSTGDTYTVSISAFLASNTTKSVTISVLKLTLESVS